MMRENIKRSSSGSSYSEHPIEHHQDPGMTPFEGEFGYEPFFLLLPSTGDLKGPRA